MSSIEIVIEIESPSAIFIDFESDYPNCGIAIMKKCFPDALTLKINESGAR